MVWEAADRICGKRLRAALPHLVESMERHGHLGLDSQVRQRLLAASAATPGPVAPTHQDTGGPPAQTKEAAVAGPQYTGANLRRLECAATGIPGD